MGLFEELDDLLTSLKDNCKMPNDPTSWDDSKGNLLLETFALEI
jgi:COP9 signalosome complex subunit 2